MFAANNPPPTHLAYVEWFEIDAWPKAGHELYPVIRSLDDNGQRLASVISLNMIQRSSSGKKYFS